MAQERLNSLAIAATHMLDVVDTAAIAQEFVSLHDSRRKTYGSSHFSKIINLAKLLLYGNNVM